jgi:hypothetical protein
MTNSAFKIRNQNNDAMVCTENIPAQLAIVCADAELNSAYPQFATTCAILNSFSRPFRRGCSGVPCKSSASAVEK